MKCFKLVQRLFVMIVIGKQKVWATIRFHTIEEVAHQTQFSLGLAVHYALPIR